MPVSPGEFVPGNRVPVLCTTMDKKYLENYFYNFGKITKYES
jgi:hypothetical protein